MKQETVLKAKRYFQEHKEHVMKMVKSTKSCFEPSGSDLDNFLLWKEGSWVWFLDTYRIYPKQYTKQEAKSLVTYKRLEWLTFKELLQLWYLERFKKVNFNMFVSLVDKGMFVGTALEIAKKFKFK